MARVTITNPTPRMTSRRKCGFGSALTNCTICGRHMVGHNRGICSTCLRRAPDSAHVLDNFAAMLGKKWSACHE